MARRRARRHRPSRHVPGDHERSHLELRSAAARHNHDVGDSSTSRTMTLRRRWSTGSPSMWVDRSGRGLSGRSLRERRSSSEARMFIWATTLSDPGAAPVTKRAMDRRDRSSASPIVFQCRRDPRHASPAVRARRAVPRHRSARSGHDHCRRDTDHGVLPVHGSYGVPQFESDGVVRSGGQSRACLDRPGWPHRRGAVSRSRRATAGAVASTAGRLRRHHLAWAVRAPPVGAIRDEYGRDDGSFHPLRRSGVDQDPVGSRA